MAPCVCKKETPNVCINRNDVQVQPISTMWELSSRLVGSSWLFNISSFMTFTSRCTLYFKWFYSPLWPVQYIYHPSEIGVMSANSTKSRTPPLQPPVNSLGQTWPAFACGQVVVPPSAKTLELGEWFNFNDSIVSRATRLVLEHSSWMGVWKKMCWLPFRKHIY